MKVIQKVIKEEGRAYYERHLNIISGLLPVRLTPKETEVLASFMALEDPDNTLDRFSTYGRKRVKEELGLSNGGLSNFIRDLKEKGVLKEGPYENLYITEWLYPEKEAQGYQFKLIKINKDVSKSNEVKEG